MGFFPPSLPSSVLTPSLPFPSFLSLFLLYVIPHFSFGVQAQCLCLPDKCFELNSQSQNLDLKKNKYMNKETVDVYYIVCILIDRH